MSKLINLQIKEVKNAESHSMHTEMIKNKSGSSMHKRTLGSQSDSIKLLENFEGIKSLTVPPSSPKTKYTFENTFNKILHDLPSLEKADLPIIRVFGVKKSLDILSEQFNCPDYKYDPIQFWFLDIIADCLWRLQDEFQFKKTHQNIIIVWILYIIVLMIDPRKNLSRAQFMAILTETINIASDYIQNGCEMLPSPTDLVMLESDAVNATASGMENEDKFMASGSDSSSDEESTDSFISIKKYCSSQIAVEMDDGFDFFQLHKNAPFVPQIHKAKQTPSIIVNDSFVEPEEVTSSKTELNNYGFNLIKEFYKPDLKVPSRFLSLSDVSQSDYKLVQDFLSGQDLEGYVTPPDYIWKPSALQEKIACPDDKSKLKITNSNIETNDLTEKSFKKEKIFNKTINMEENIFVNNCALLVIKQFILDYFADSFNYKLIKLALSNKHFMITQNVNEQWKVPKILRDELKKPKPKKPKKSKKGKKKKKKDKKSKKSKKSSKKSNKSKKSKKPKKSKKSTKSKKTKLSKKELAKLKAEAKKREEELRRIEENRRLLFPLNNATTDEFFKSIFDNWVKPKQKKGKKGKKGKK